jgi:hemin uptake protein HemP
MSAPISTRSIERMPPRKPFAGRPSRQGSHGSQSFATDGSGLHRAIEGVRYHVDELLKGGREAILVHRGQEYRLRITSTGKLILTK